MVEQTFELEGIAYKLAEAVGAQAEITADKIYFHTTKKNTKISPLNVGDLEGVISRLSKSEVIDGLTLHSSHNFEVTVRQHSRNPSPYGLFREDFSIQDHDNQCVFTLSPVSPEYLVFYIMLVVPTIGKMPYYYGSYGRGYEDAEEEQEEPGQSPQEDITTDDDDVAGDSIFDIIHKFALRLNTVAISSKPPRSVEEFHHLLDSFLFQLSYNMEVAIVAQHSAAEAQSGFRPRRMMRVRLRDMNPPKRRYGRELIYYYQMAVASDAAMLKFVSYYHVLEYFFHRIYMDDLNETLKAKLTSPDFTYKRRQDLDDVVQIVGDALRFKGEHVQIDEKRALELTIRKYVPLSNLKSKLFNYDETLLKYYASNIVSFSRGCQVVIDEANDHVFGHLAKRIYLTRNAIVHRKDSDHARFTPFRDDAALAMELPLMRFLAEEVILATSHPYE